MKKCIICGNSGKYKELVVKEMMIGTNDLFIYLECGICGCLQIKEIPKNIKKYYPENYYSFNRVKSNYLKLFLTTLRNIQSFFFETPLDKIMNKYFPIPSYIKILKIIKAQLNWNILDVGSGVGGKLSSLKKIGFKNILGIDPYITKDIYYDSGLRILKKTLSEIKGEFDLILFDHSLEHMEDPVNVLKEAGKKMKHNSFIVIRIPLHGGYSSRKYGVNWAQLDAPRHLFIPTKNSMNILAEQVGLNIFKTFYDSTIFQFYASEQYQKGIPLLSPHSYSVSPSHSIFTRKNIRDFLKKSEKLNLDEDGDQASFILTKVKN